MSVPVFFITSESISIKRIMKYVISYQAPYTIMKVTNFMKILRAVSMFVADLFWYLNSKNARYHCLMIGRWAFSLKYLQKGVLAFCENPMSNLDGNNGWNHVPTINMGEYLENGQTYCNLFNNFSYVFHVIAFPFSNLIHMGQGKTGTFASLYCTVCQMNNPIVAKLKFP